MVWMLKALFISFDTHKVYVCILSQILSLFRPDDAKIWLYDFTLYDCMIIVTCHDPVLLHEGTPRTITLEFKPQHANIQWENLLKCSEEKVEIFLLKCMMNSEIMNFCLRNWNFANHRHTNHSGYKMKLSCAYIQKPRVSKCSFSKDSKAR